MMAKPIRALELQYPMIQFLIKPIRKGEIFDRKSLIKPPLSNKPSFSGEES